MPKDLIIEDAPIGDVQYEWVFNEYTQFERSRRWYIVMGIFGTLLVATGVLTGNYMFAFIIILAGVILFLQEMQTPPEVYFAITTTGIILGTKFFRYRELDRFWILYTSEEVRSLYFILNNNLKNRLQIPLLDYDPAPIRDFLKQYVLEDLDEEDEPLSERFSRAMRLQ